MVIKEQEDKLSIAASYLALGAIGVISIFYSIFMSTFAELHVTISSLPFPIFIGEILLFFCLLLLCFKKREIASTPLRWRVLFVVYVVWLLSKAIYGYVTMGPLALRTSALFYYPFFAVMGYYFFHTSLLTRNIKIILLGLLLAGAVTRVVNSYFFATYLFLFYAVLTNMQKKKFVFIKVFFTVFLLIHSRILFFTGSRSHVLAIVGASIFLLIFMFCIIKLKRRYKFLIVAAILVSFFAGVYQYSDRNSITSLVNLRHVAEQYKINNDIIKDKKKDYCPWPIRVKIFNKDYVNLSDKMFNKTGIEEETTASIGNTGRIKVAPREGTEEIPFFEQNEGTANADGDDIAAQPEWRNLDVAYVNILFRLFIWRDMIVDLIEDEAVWTGVNFAKPQRSISLEILNWAEWEWRRDGWITPHNSFLHVIYRAGIWGAIMIIGFFGFFIVLIRDFIRLRSLTGGLLLSIFVYWIIFANFLVVLEFPYYAIPFWTLFGLTGSYRDDILKERNNENLNSA